MSNVNDLAVRLSAIKAVRDHLDTAERATKTALRGLLDAGDRKHARLPNGEDAATITVTAPKDGLRVTDAAAFTAWCKTHHPDAIIEQVRTSDQAAILAAATKTGDMPDGVDYRPAGAPTVTVRMTADQQDALMDAFRNGRIAFADVLALGARNEPDK